jgi:hypothetical protein
MKMAQAPRLCHLFIFVVTLLGCCLKTRVQENMSSKNVSSESMNSGGKGVPPVLEKPKEAAQVRHLCRLLKQTFAA